MRILGYILGSLLLASLCGCEAASAQNAGSGAATRSATACARAYAPILLLDSVSVAPNFAFSVNERLRTAYTGSLGRIRRASDNAETDVGYGSDNLVAQSTITTHCSGTTCFWKTLYDQSGNTRDVTQATTTKQPSAYSAGAVRKNGANVVAVHDGTDDWFNRADSSGFSGAASGTFFTLLKLNAINAQFSQVTVGAASHDISIINVNNTTIECWTNGDTGHRQFPTTNTNAYHYDVVTIAGNANTVVWRQNGSALSASATTANAVNITGSATNVGTYDQTNGNISASYSDVIVWASVLSAADIATVETWAEARRNL